jgi:nitrous oxide reductase
MLAKKYSDSGGLLSEEDATFLTRKYSELGDMQNKYTRLSTKPKKTKADEEKLTNMMGEMADKRREIVDMETSYSTLFNHTADNKAQNKVILWYLVNLTYYQENEDDDIKPFFEAEDSDEKIEQYYEIDEGGHDIFDLAKDKLSTFLSFWYFSSNATKEDFDQLGEDINSGNV